MPHLHPARLSVIAIRTSMDCEGTGFLNGHALSDTRTGSGLCERSGAKLCSTHANEVFPVLGG